MGGDGRPNDGGGGGGGHPHQFQYQALLAAVHTQGPNNTLPFPLPPLNGPGADSPTNSAARQPPTPRGFSDWSASTSAFTSLVQNPPSSNAANAYHYSLSPCYAFWTHYMLNKNAYSYYPAPNQEHGHPFYHDNNQAKDPGSVPSFGLDSFSTTSLAPNMSAHMPPMEMPPMEGPLSVKEPELSEDVPARVVRIKDEMETRHGVELKCETADTLPELKQGHESCATKFNSGEYQVILRKELTKSDVANVGRIVLPKKDAEASLPPLCERDPLILQMDDMVLPVTWKFKYRFWPNNKSRMYILDSTTEFVKTHGLQAGDTIIIYKNPVPGKYIVRGEKAIQQTLNH
ncbi:B3 domain-containing protein IDEF1-like [Lolium rigidum]|uniref:B3 domain-containing protein IDEF1-like n=1 Tax=Lolium rigidum TaxID=89674 RepID=UPI001F5D0CFA|nr:B3 domain-containing protein IDEF1-like [Lolium rigidum]